MVHPQGQEVPCIKSGEDWRLTWWLKLGFLTLAFQHCRSGTEALLFRAESHEMPWSCYLAARGAHDAPSWPQGWWLVTSSIADGWAGRSSSTLPLVACGCATVALTYTAGLAEDASSPLPPKQIPRHEELSSSEGPAGHLLWAFLTTNFSSSEHSRGRRA